MAAQSGRRDVFHHPWKALRFQQGKDSRWRQCPFDEVIDGVVSNVTSGRFATGEAVYTKAEVKHNRLHCYARVPIVNEQMQNIIGSLA